MNKYRVYQTKNECYIKGTPMQPAGILVHSTGCNNPWLKRYVDALDFQGPNQYGNHWNQPGIRKCMHGFIGKDKSGIISWVQTQPYNIASWGCGSGRNGSYNRNPTGHIQFEICEDGLTNKLYYNEAFKAAEDICVELCKTFNQTADKITSHYEAYALGFASNHGDPKHWMSRFNDSMDKFRARIAIRLQEKPSVILPDITTLDEKKIKVQITRTENAEYFNKNLNDIVEVDFEKYIEGVVASEIGNVHIEACKAQAVAARTYALNKTQGGGAISDSSSTAQAFRAPRMNNPAYANCQTAVSATAGEVMFYKDKLVDTAVYSDTNGGHIISAKEHWGTDKPYLISKPDPWDQAISKGIKNGHGVGMSQTGAKYAASTGVEYKQILAFYYPNTRLTPKYGEGEVLTIEPKPEVPAEQENVLINMTGKYAKITTSKDEGLNLWSDIRKSRSLLKVPKGKNIFIIEDKLSGWVLAMKDEIKGYVDKRYLVLAPENEQNEAELEPPVSEEPTVQFKSYQAKVNTKYDDGLGLWNNTSKNLRLAKIKKGELITVVDEINSQWAVAEYNNLRGYVDRRYLRKIEEIIVYNKNGLTLAITCKTEDQLNKLVKLIDELNS